jgi:hypothetical protein
MKLKKRPLITWAIIIAVIILAIFLMNKSPANIEKATAKCIGANSKLYIQLGCHACAIQEEMFGENYQYLDVVDCFYEKEKCLDLGIAATPTWIINGEQYTDVLEIEELKELTGC